MFFEQNLAVVAARKAFAPDPVVVLLCAGMSTSTWKQRCRSGSAEYCRSFGVGSGGHRLAPADQHTDRGTALCLHVAAHLQRNKPMHSLWCLVSYVRLRLAAPDAYPPIAVS